MNPKQPFEAQAIPTIEALKAGDSIARCQSNLSNGELLRSMLKLRVHLATVIKKTLAPTSALSGCIAHYGSLEYSFAQLFSPLQGALMCQNQLG